MVQNYVWRLRKRAGDRAAARRSSRAGARTSCGSTASSSTSCRLERLVSEAARAAAAGDRRRGARGARAVPRRAARRRRRRAVRDRGDPPARGAAPDAPPSWRSTPTWPRAATTRSSPRSTRCWPRTRCASGCTRSGCWRSTAAAARPRRSRPTAHARATLVEEIGIEPGARAAARCTPRSCARTRRWTSSRPRTSCRRELDAAASPPLIGRDASCGDCGRCWRRPRGRGRARDARRRVRDGQDAARRRAGARRATARARRSSTRPGRARPRSRSRRSRARARRAGRRCSCSTTPTARPPRCARALRELARRAALPALVLATGQEAAALARLEPRRRARARAARRRRACGRSPACTRRQAARCRSRRCSGTAAASPRRVHEAASEWARREATRRVDALADRAAAGRSEARALEAELAGSVVDLQSTRERVERFGRDGDRRDAPVVCPYKGLATFDARRRRVLLRPRASSSPSWSRTLVGAPLLAVVGPSGQRQVVGRPGRAAARAGGRRAAAAATTGRRRVIRPGEHPLRELRRATRRLAPHGRSVLVVDQFEELFTACQDERERAEFVAGAACARARDGRVVVLAVRADFYGRCAAYPELSRAARRQPRARRPDVARRAAARDRAPGAARRPERRAGARRGAAGRRRGPARRAAAAVDGAARAVAPARRAAPATRRLRAQRRRPGRGRAAGRGRVRRARPGPAGGGAHAAAAPERRGRERRDRAPADRARRARGERTPRSSPGSPSAAC